MERVYGFARNVLTGAPAPSATITVYNGGTLVPAVIYGDNLLNPKANPFTADATTAYWFFYAASGRYDVAVSGVGITSYTQGDIVAGAIFSLNGLTDDTQTFAIGSTGAAPNWVSALGVHTLHLPLAAAGVTSGLISNAGQTIAGAKTFTTPIAPGSGGTGTTAPTANGQLLIGSAGGTYTKATLTGTANQITIANGAGSITLSTPQDIAAASSPTFVALTLSGLTANGVLYANAGKQPTSLALTNGQLLIGSTGAAPVAAAITGTGGVTVTLGAGTIQIGAPVAMLSLNGLTDTAQTLALGTSGADLNWVSSSPTHTLNVPDASSSARGVITTGSQTLAGVKTLSSPPVLSGGAGTFAAGGTGGPSATMSGEHSTVTTPVTVTGTVAKTALITKSLEGNVLSANGKKIRVVAIGTKTGTAGTTTFEFAYGAGTLALVAIGAAQAGGVRLEAILVRTGAATEDAHAYSMVAAAFNNSFGTMAIDTTAAQTVKFSVTLGNSGDSVTINDMFIEVIG